MANIPQTVEDVPHYNRASVKKHKCVILMKLLTVLNNHDQNGHFEWLEFITFRK